MKTSPLQKRDKLAPGLYLVATPIGNARDITLRALDILSTAEVLAAEDTRSLRKLMGLHQIPTEDRSLVAYHDHNRESAEARLLALLKEGASVAYVSEAGTPLISDPGFGLARDAKAAGINVTCAPGASAVIDALLLSGLPTDAFTFAGFLPSSMSQKRARLAQLGTAPGSLVVFESPKRITATLEVMVDVFGGSTQIALCRELTKKFEEVLQGSVEEILTKITSKPPKGEIVLVIGPRRSVSNASDVKGLLSKLLQTHKMKDAARMVAAEHNLSVREVYQMALTLQTDAGER